MQSTQFTLAADVNDTRLSAPEIARSAPGALPSFAPARNRVPTAAAKERATPLTVIGAELLERCHAGFLRDPRVSGAEQHSSRFESHVDELPRKVDVVVRAKVLAHLA